MLGRVTVDRHREVANFTLARSTNLRRRRPATHGRSHGPYHYPRAAGRKEDAVLMMTFKRAVGGGGKLRALITRPPDRRRHVLHIDHFPIPRADRVVNRQVVISRGVLRRNEGCEDDEYEPGSC